PRTGTIGENPCAEGNATMTPSRLQRIDELVRELSFHDDPDRLIRAFGKQSGLLFRHDGLVTLNRRDLAEPHYRVTRSWRCADAATPWTEGHRLPVFDRGLLGQLLYDGKPLLVNQLQVPAGDPLAEHLDGMRSLICAPGYEQGHAMHLVVALRQEPDAFA